MLLIMGVQLYTSRIILSNLGIRDYGIYNVVGGVVIMFTTITSSLSGATSRFITFELGKKNFERLHQIFNTAFIAHCVIAILVVLLSETLGLWLFNTKLTIPTERMNAAFWVYQISVLTTVFSITQVPYNACIIAHEDMKIYAYVGIIEVILKLLIVYVLKFLLFDKLILYAILLFIVQVGIMMLYRYYCRNYKETKLKFHKETKLFKEIFIYAGSDLIGNISVLAQGQGLNVLLNIFFGPTVNAARAIAYQVQGAVTQFSNNFFTAARPQIIKLYAENNIEEMMKLVYNSSWISFYMLIMITLPLCLEREYILSLWLGEYPEHTSSFLILIIILCLIQTLKMPRTTVLHATGHILLGNVTVGIILCAAFPLAYFFLKMGGNPESVFWAANISMITSEILGVFILRKYIKYSISDYIKNIHCRCLFVLILSGGLLYFMQSMFEASFLRLIIMSISSVVIISFIAYSIGINSAMRNSINLTINSKIKSIKLKCLFSSKKNNIHND